MLSMLILRAEKRSFFLTTIDRDVKLSTSKRGAVAQLGEHKAGSLGVRGSIPLSSTKNIKGLA